jgi:hypothetical protein
LLLVRARARIERFVASRPGRRTVRAMGALPIATACLVALGGLLVAVRAGAQLA